MKFHRCAMLVAALSMTFCYAHTLASGPVDGLVVDPDTKQPVAGAVVVAKWGLGAGSGDSLFASHFNISLDAYKPSMTNIRRTVIKQEDMTGALELAHWSGTHPGRMGWLQAKITSNELTCDGDAGGHKVLEAVRETIYAEVNSIATADDEDQKIVRHLDTVRRNLAALHSQAG